MNIFISPHLDDVVLSCYSALDHDSVVLTIFSGAPRAEILSDWDARAGATSSKLVMRRRREEDIAATRTAGATVRHLGFLEEAYRICDPDYALIGRALVDEIAKASAVWVPAGYGQHPDHRVAALLAIAVARAARVPIAIYLEYPYWRNTQRRLDITDDEEMRDAIYSWYEQSLKHQVGRDAQPNLHIKELSAEMVTRKLAAIYEYRSQLACLDASVGGQLLLPEFVGREYFLTFKNGHRRDGT